MSATPGRGPGPGVASALRRDANATRSDISELLKIRLHPPCPISSRVQAQSARAADALLPIPSSSTFRHSIRGSRQGEDSSSRGAAGTRRREIYAVSRRSPAGRGASANRKNRCLQGPITLCGRDFLAVIRCRQHRHRTLRSRVEYFPPLRKYHSQNHRHLLKRI